MNADEMELIWLSQSENRRSKKASHWTRREPPAGSFLCRNCQNHVPTHSAISGVQNRNHCPYCLWSRHVDLHCAGDRLAACKAPMRPIGLALKRTYRKYGPSDSGEIMLIHRCSDCGKISINRIAADDDPHRILELFDASIVMNTEIAMLLRSQDIDPLTADQLDLVKVRLFGIPTSLP